MNLATNKMNEIGNLREHFADAMTRCLDLVAFPFCRKEEVRALASK